MFSLVIVDDDENVLEGLCFAVNWRKLGFEVTGAAKDGVEALKIIQEKSCDALLTDIRMGKMDGLELIEKIRENSNMPVVVMSAYEDFHYAQKAVKLGVMEYIVKPIDISQLYETMRLVYQKLVDDSQLKEQKKEENSIKRMTAEEARQANEVLNTALVDHLIKMILLGNIKEIEIETVKLWEHLVEISGGSYLFILTVFSRMADNLEKDGSLSNSAKELLKEAKIQFFTCTSKENCLELMKDAFCRIANTTKRIDGDKENLILQAKQYIDKNYKNPNLRVKKVANHIGISTNYFSSLFTQFMGECFSDYLIRLRITEACLLINKTTMKTYEIAESVGYENAAYFSSAFKNYTGMSVSDYRNLIR